MASKKKLLENVALQIECEDDAQWKQLLRREGLIVVDVYAGWAGPCLSMLSILKRVKVEINNDKFWLGAANSDNISDLLMFKDQSEPTWLFIGGGKPVRVMRGSNAPKLIAAMKSEFQHELLCIAGKAKRTLISIDDEVARRRKAEAEAQRLLKFIKDEEASAQGLNNLRQKSSIQLKSNTDAYSVIAIQSYLLDTGVVTEVRDSLEGEFKIEKEVIMTLDEPIARNLFRIPLEIPDPAAPVPNVDDFGYNEEAQAAEESDTEKEPSEAEAEGEEEGESETEQPEPDELGLVSAPSESSFKQKKNKEPPKPKTIHIELPYGVAGDTLFMLVESLDLRKMFNAGIKPASGSAFQTADDYLQVKAGPIDLQDALKLAPDSWHALYGREKYACGVWVPRRYDDRRYAMLNFFPRFVTELLMPPPATGKQPKYMIAVFPPERAGEVAKEVDFHRKDILAEGQVKLTEDVADEMLHSWNTPGWLHHERLIELTKPVYAISVDKKNSALMLALKALDPLHISYDAGYGKIETAKVFEYLDIRLDDLPDSDLVVEKFLARSAPRIIEIQNIDGQPVKPLASTLKVQAIESRSGVSPDPEPTGASPFEESPSQAQMQPSSSRAQIQQSSSRAQIQQSSSRAQIQQSSSRAQIQPSSSMAGIQPSSSMAGIQPSSSRAQIQPSSSRAEIQPSSSRAEIQQSSSKAQIQPSSSRAEIQPSSSRTEIQQSSSRAQIQPSSSRAEIQQSSSKAQIQPSSSRAEIQPSSSRAEIQQSSSKSHIQPSSSVAQVQPSSSRAEIQQSSSRAEIQQSSSKAQVQPSSSRAEIQQSSSKAQIQPSSSVAKVQPSSSRAEIQPSSSRSEIQQSSSVAQVQPSSSRAEIQPSSSRTGIQQSSSKAHMQTDSEGEDGGK